MLYRYLLCLALCLVLSFPGFSQDSSGRNPAGWVVLDPTETLALTTIEERDSTFTLSFKNISTEIITAVALSFRENVQQYEDWLNAESTGLASGHSFEVTAGPEDVANRTVRILAVIFEDGSGKGMAAQLDLMNFHRLGQIVEGTRIGDILRNGPPSRNDSGMTLLTQRIGKMPQSSEEAFNSLEKVNVPGISIVALRRNTEKLRNAFFWGVSVTRERALRQIENVKQLPAISTDEKMPSRAAVLSFILEQYDKQNKKAAALLPHMQRGR
jgi:hypothetical protein